MNTHLYPSDLSDQEWAILEPLITPGKQAGHPQLIELRRIVDAVFYLLRTGCQWRAMPHAYPPWSTVFYHFAKWRSRGTWERINAALRGRHRVAKGRKPQPTAAIIDSQSVRTTEAGGPRGYDGAKKPTPGLPPIGIRQNGLFSRLCMFREIEWDRAVLESATGFDQPLRCNHLAESCGDDPSSTTFVTVQ